EPSETPSGYPTPSSAYPEEPTETPGYPSSASQEPTEAPSGYPSSASPQEPTEAPSGYPSSAYPQEPEPTETECEDDESPYPTGAPPTVTVRPTVTVYPTPPAEPSSAYPVHPPEETPSGYPTESEAYPTGEYPTETEVVTKYITFCPSPTTITYGTHTYTVTEVNNSVPDIQPSYIFSLPPFHRNRASNCMEPD
ncbi:hypothetical protein RJ035_006561, partial [Blastomyces gilchristii]